MKLFFRSPGALGIREKRTLQKSQVALKDREGVQGGCFPAQRPQIHNMRVVRCFVIRGGTFSK